MVQIKRSLDKLGVSKEEYFKSLESQGFERGVFVQGNFGATLLPYPEGDAMNSTDDVIQVYVNSKGTLNHRAIRVAHEFGHVVLYLKGLPHGHPKADREINKRTNEVKEN